jgi:hypothetical protein
MKLIEIAKVGIITIIKSGIGEERKTASKQQRSATKEKRFPQHTEEHFRH